MAHFQHSKSRNRSDTNRNRVLINVIGQAALPTLVPDSHPNKENLADIPSNMPVNGLQAQTKETKPAIYITTHSQQGSEVSSPALIASEALIDSLDRNSGSGHDMEHVEHGLEPARRKRRRLFRQSEDGPATTYFDPNQSSDERRRIRKGLRDLNKEAQDSKSEWLTPNSNGIQHVVIRANKYFDSVKQTSDATIDSRLLVTAGDLTYKKTSQIVLGESTHSIDVDEFVSKFITFMRDTTSRRFSAHGRRAYQREELEHESDDEGERDPGDALEWEWTGEHICFQYNLRPPAPGFLLGPLSLQKQSRAPRARREKLQRATLVEADRPDELQVVDLANTETSDVKTICTRIHHQLTDIISVGHKKVQEQFHEDISDEDYQRLLSGNHLASNGGVPLLNFVLHPTSFGQTVENLFYISFLIKDGAVGIDSDDTGLPVLHVASNSEEQSGITTQQDLSTNEFVSIKHQAVLRLDFETWEGLVDIFQIDQCLIPDRLDENAIQVGSSQWYG